MFYLLRSFDGDNTCVYHHRVFLTHYVRLQWVADEIKEHRKLVSDTLTHTTRMVRETIASNPEDRRATRCAKLEAVNIMKVFSRFFCLYLIKTTVRPPPLQPTGRWSLPACVCVYAYIWEYIYSGRGASVGGCLEGAPPVRWTVYIRRRGALPPIVLANEKVGRAPARSLPFRQPSVGMCPRGWVDKHAAVCV